MEAVGRIGKERVEATSRRHLFYQHKFKKTIQQKLFIFSCQKMLIGLLPPLLLLPEPGRFIRMPTIACVSALVTKAEVAKKAVSV